jgi:hypothetical protein
VQWWLAALPGWTIAGGAVPRPAWRRAGDRYPGPIARPVPGAVVVSPPPLARTASPWPDPSRRPRNPRVGPGYPLTARSRRRWAGSPSRCHPVLAGSPSRSRSKWCWPVRLLPPARAAMPLWIGGRRQRIWRTGVNCGGWSGVGLASRWPGCRLKSVVAPRSGAPCHRVPRHLPWDWSGGLFLRAAKIS